MSKLEKKMLFPIGTAIVIILLLSVILNLYFLQSFMLNRQKRILDEVSEKVLESGTADNENGFLEMEQMYDITIVSFPFSNEEDRFNKTLRDMLKERGIGFLRLWLWEDSFSQLKKNGSITKLYDQGRLQYAILVQYTLHEEKVYAVVKNIPHTKEILKWVNCITLIIFGFGGIFIFGFVWISVRRVTNPLYKLTQFTEKLSRQDFDQITIKTGDEIEKLAKSFNNMSLSLEKVQSELAEKNKNMEELLSNVFHEVKTPVALIKAYGSGIKDGMDDGTFLDVLLEQNDKIDRTVEEILNLSRIQQNEINEEEFSLTDLVAETIRTYQFLADLQMLSVQSELDSQIFITADKKIIHSAIINLVTNSLKYGREQITVKLMLEKDIPVFKISNPVSKDINLNMERIWEPFYVGETSRCKELSGTGLGLSVVKAALDRHGYSCLCERKNEIFQVTIWFKKDDLCIRECE